MQNPNILTYLTIGADLRTKLTVPKNLPTKLEPGICIETQDDKFPVLEQYLPDDWINIGFD